MSDFVKFMGENTWVAILIGALAGLIVAYATIATQRNINRRRATVDMINLKLWDGDYYSTADIFYSIMKEQKKLMEFYDAFIEVRDLKRSGKWDAIGEEEQRKYAPAVDTILKVKAILNDRELVAIGIREGTYDEVIYRRWWYSTFMEEWRASVTLISRIRSDVQAPPLGAAYSEMEALAKRWQAEGPWTTQDRHFRLPGGRIVTISRSR